MASFSLQRNIMSFVGSDSALPGARIADGARDCTTPLGCAGENVSDSCCLSPADLFSISTAAARAGSPCVIVKDGFLGRAEAMRVYEAAQEVEEAGALRPAGMGSGKSLWYEEESRGDSIAWITGGIEGTGRLPEALGGLLHRLSALRDQLGGAAERGSEVHLAGLHLVDRTSVQLAKFPGDGRGYVRHRDTPACAEDEGQVHRKITALYYLNPEWKTFMEGQLRIHLNSAGGDSCSETWDIEPLLDRLVLFRSDLVDHEVLPTFAPRLAITMWFYGKHVGTPLTPSSGTRSISRPNIADVEPIAPAQEPSPEDDTRGRVRPLPTCDGNDGAHASEASIFVSIASYRDPEANPTIIDLFARASNPHRVAVGLVWQLDLSVDEDMAMYRATPGGDSLRGGCIRSLVMPAGDAAGPSWARRVAQSLSNTEEYMLQIDSHTRFRPGWDSYLIRTLQRCLSFKPILTTYPVGYHLPHKIPAGETRPTLLVPDGFGADGMLRQKGRLLMRMARDPLPSPLWASGFSFSSSALIHEVPYDPGLRHVFFGEEISMAARMFTRGWDFFAPPQTVVYHLWSRAHRPSFRQVSTQSTKAEEGRARRRISGLLGVCLPADGTDTSDARATEKWLALEGEPYGLGDERSLASFADRVGVDFRTSTVTSAEARNAGRPASDFNDNLALGLEDVLRIVKADVALKGVDAGRNGGEGDVGPSPDR